MIESASELSPFSYLSSITETQGRLSLGHNFAESSSEFKVPFEFFLAN